MNKEIAAFLNDKGLESFAKGDAGLAKKLLKIAYSQNSDELGILVNLGLALKQIGQNEYSKKCYEIARKSESIRIRRAANKNLGFCYLNEGRWTDGWGYHFNRFEGESFLGNIWKGDSLNGQELLIWNDVGMGDIFNFIRYTKKLVDSGEKIKLAVDKNQINIIKRHLRWPVHNIIDRDKMGRPEDYVIHIPLMNLISVMDPDTSWGRSWQENTWEVGEKTNSINKIGICWSSNPKDKSMQVYKSAKLNEFIKLIPRESKKTEIISLQTGCSDEHKEFGLEQCSYDWEETMQKIYQCDEVYAVDTAIAHLAAGAGKKVMLYLNSPEDWRWRNGQIWYKNIKKNFITY